jgi:hypothetical protein
MTLSGIIICVYLLLLNKIEINAKNLQKTVDPKILYKAQSFFITSLTSSFLVENSNATDLYMYLFKLII